MINQNKQEMLDAYSIAGLFTLSLRMVVGWTYFSAFWRRLVLENKLIPDAPVISERNSTISFLTPLV